MNKIRKIQDIQDRIEKIKHVVGALGFMLISIGFAPAILGYAILPETNLISEISLNILQSIGLATVLGISIIMCILVPLFFLNLSLIALEMFLEK